jgi:hypothetical protein
VSCDLHPFASSLARVSAIAPESSAGSCARNRRVRRHSPSTVSKRSPRPRKASPAGRSLLRDRSCGACPHAGAPSGSSPS